MPANWRTSITLLKVALLLLRVLIPSFFSSRDLISLKSPPMIQWSVPTHSLRLWSSSRKACLWVIWNGPYTLVITPFTIVPKTWKQATIRCRVAIWLVRLIRFRFHNTLDPQGCFDFLQSSHPNFSSGIWITFSSSNRFKVRIKQPMIRNMCFLWLSTWRWYLDSR